MKKFSLTINGATYNFELDNFGQVWHLEKDTDLVIIRNAFNHELTHDIDEAKIIAKKILYSKGLLG